MSTSRIASQNYAASALLGRSEIHQPEEREIFGDILEGIAQEERDAKDREEEREVN